MLSNYRVIDLSHELHPEVPNWTGDCGFQSSIDIDYGEADCRIMSYQLVAGIGTHMDAPLHFVPEAASISEIPIENLVAPLCVIRVSIGENNDYLISEKDIVLFERQHGRIPEASLVAADTGWAQYWNDSKLYRNEDQSGQMHFPGFHVDAVELLLHRKIVGIGIDTLSPDGGNTDFAVHHLIFLQKKYIIENLANMHLIPEFGAWVIALPPKIHGGAEAPCRCIALVP